jgi:uncharacterized damage-inducible protein DinB
VIDKDYVLTMARYNAWQNRQLMEIVPQIKKADLMKDQGAFFGSILETLNHLLWGDTVWMSRWCLDVATPEGGIEGSRKMTKTIGDWQAERFRMDGRIRIWAETLTNLDLIRTLSWYSGALDQNVQRPLRLCIAHMFNHQTHHRGQVHAMITALGHAAPTTDLFAMPEDC